MIRQYESGLTLRGGRDRGISAVCSLTELETAPTRLIDLILEILVVAERVWQVWGAGCQTLIRNWAVPRIRVKWREDVRFPV